MGNENNNGWICLHRSILEWEHWNEPNHVAKVFITLLLCANHQRKWWHGIRCERGETLVTVERLCDKTGLSKPTIIKALRILEDSGEITRKRIDQKNTKTIIKKYAEYQLNNPLSSKKDLPQSLPQTLPQSLPKQQLNKENNSVVVDNARTHEEKVEGYMGDQITLERFCMAEHITPQDFRKLVDEVVTEWELTSESDTSKRHMVNTMRVKLRAKREAEKNQSKADKRKAWEDDLMAGALQTLNEIYKN